MRGSSLFFVCILHENCLRSNEFPISLSRRKFSRCRKLAVDSNNSRSFDGTSSGMTSLPDQNTPLGSLDYMLKRARKRKGVDLHYRLQAVWDAPLLKLESPYPSLKSSLIFSRGDGFLVLIAVAIHATGFALGLLIGKATAGPFREIFQPPASVELILMPIWPVLWAIVLDQMIVQ